MRIHYITGRSGAGKTERVYQEIRTALENGEKRLILIVPEHFTLQAERTLIQKLDQPGILDAEVLSFSRLAYKVFNTVGGIAKTRINNQGRHMILRKLLDELRDDLRVYRSVSARDGFIEKINDLLVELKRHDISPQMLYEQAEKEGNSGLLPDKLKDIALVYDSFNKYLADKYLDPEDEINVLIERMEEADFLKGARVWLDGFDYFTPRDIRVIDKLLALVKSLTITFTIGDEETDTDLDIFKSHQLSLKKIRALAEARRIEEQFTYLSPYSNEEYIANKAPEIRHLEQEIYKYPYRQYSGKVENLKVFAANNLESETEMLAAQIISLVREKGWRFNQIAVVTADMESYGSIIKRVFSEYGIPFFMDEKRPVIQNPIIDVVLVSLRVVYYHYSFEDVFRLLKTGFFQADASDIELLENYCLEFGIRGQRWHEEFNLGGDVYDLSRLNRLRKEIMTSFLALEKGVRGEKNIADMVKALYEYLTAINLQERIKARIDELKQKGLFDRVYENAQIWNIVMETFEQLVEILGDQRVSLKEFMRILEAGFSSLEVGIIPTTLDQVLVGNIQRSKNHDVKALFILGCNDEVLPSVMPEHDLLSEEERDLLQERGMELGSNSILRSSEEKFSIYTAFSTPSDYLWVSYALADMEGKALRPSILIDRLKKLFKNLEIASDVIWNEEIEKHLIATPDSTYKYMVANMRQYADGKPISKLWLQLYSWYHQKDEWKEKRDELKRALFYRNQVQPIGRCMAKELYSSPIRASVSRLEQYIRCPFAHFIRYGLRPREQNRYEVAAPDVGELFHLSIESFVKKLEEEAVDWRSVDDDKCEELIEEIMEELIPQHKHGVLLSTGRYKYLCNRLKRVSKRAVWLLTDHIRRSSFSPLGNEVSFGTRGTYPPIEIELTNSEKILLEGRIDRADIYIDGKDVYINVIDYKSGNQNFDLSDAYFGLNLQLLVYLEALLNFKQQSIEGRARPGGIFYFKIDDPLINSQEQLDEEAIKKEIRKKLKLKGLVLKDINIVRKMDRTIERYSEVLPVRIKKDETFYDSSSLLSENEFINLLAHVKNLIKEIGESLLSGHIDIMPVKKGKETACRYCSYTGICQFDSKFRDNRYRTVPRLKKKDIIERLTRDEERGMAQDEVDCGTTGRN
ncbi:MAG: helicase-exonuclease AddAB subunit AddB [Clostridiales bacterium]|nr:helicase-exonuclease AddAB subunit AddB [Clostridiales bacterium]